MPKLSELNSEFLTWTYLMELSHTNIDSEKYEQIDAFLKAMFGHAVISKQEGARQDETPV